VCRQTKESYLERYNSKILKFYFSPSKHGSNSFNGGIGFDVFSAVEMTTAGRTGNS